MKKDLVEKYCKICRHFSKCVFNHNNENCTELKAMLRGYELAKNEAEEKPVEGLEEEIERYLRDECSSDDEPAVSEIARHFYEFGCRRTAEKYDEIEYNRQRAEEKQVDGLEDEAESYWIEAGWSKVMTLGRFKTIARHFAEWGRNT